MKFSVDGGDIIYRCAATTSIYQGFAVITDKAEAYQFDPKGTELLPRTTITVPSLSLYYSVYSVKDGTEIIGFGKRTSAVLSKMTGYVIGSQAPTSQIDIGSVSINTFDSAQSKVIGEELFFYLTTKEGKLHKITSEDGTDVDKSPLQITSGRLGAVDQSSLLPHDVLVGTIENVTDPALTLVGADLDPSSKVPISTGNNYAVLFGQIEAVPTYQGFFVLTLTASNISGRTVSSTADTLVLFVDISTREVPVVSDVTSEVAIGGEPIYALKFIGNHRILATGINGSSGPSFYQEITFSNPVDLPCHDNCGSCNRAGIDCCLTCKLNFSKESDDTTEGVCIPNVIIDKLCGGTDITACVECSKSPATTCKKCLLNYGLNAKESVGGTECTECEDPKCLICNKIGGDVCQQCITGVNYNSDEKKCSGHLVSVTLLGLGLLFQFSEFF